MASVIGFIHRNYQIFSPREVPKAQNALKFGILGAANIVPNSLLKPAKSHPEVIIQAVAARDRRKAEAYAKKHGIPQVMDNYQAVIDDPAIDVIYNPLPNGLHYEWTLKALAKGKHVLLEKPSVSNAEEAEALFRSPLLKKPNAPVLLEALHYQFQPAWPYFLTLVDRPSLEQVSAAVTLPLFLDKNNIRFKYELSGGSMLDLGTYEMSALRAIFAAEPEECLECTVRKCAPPNELCDEAANIRFRFPGGGIGLVEEDLRPSALTWPTIRIAVTHKAVPVPDDKLLAGQEKVRVRKLWFGNFIVTAMWHRIDIEDEFIVRKTDGGAVVKRWTEKTSKKIYTFKDAGIDQPSEPFWTSYRHQLEQFVNRIRGREGSGLWVGAEDSIGHMKMIDMAYGKTDLPLRPTSRFQL